jgi:hypothetical protein
MFFVHRHTNITRRQLHNQLHSTLDSKTVLRLRVRSSKPLSSNPIKRDQSKNAICTPFIINMKTSFHSLFANSNRHEAYSLAFGIRIIIYINPGIHADFMAPFQQLVASLTKVITFNTTTVIQHYTVSAHDHDSSFEELFTLDRL